MAELSPALARALERGDAPFFLYYADHPNGAARYWSRTGWLDYGGYQWGGFGILGAISAVTRSTNLTINDVYFVLRGVPPTTAAQLSGLVRNRVAQVTLGAISRRGRVTVDSDPLIDALLDVQTLKTDPKSQMSELRLSAQQGFYVLDRAQDIACSHEQQIADFPGDTGMSLMHLYQNKESNWRAS